MDINKKIRIFKKPSLYIKVKYIFAAVTVLFSLIAALGLFLLAMSFVKVGDIEIIGTNPYDRLEIIQATELKSNDNWSRVDTDAIEEKLLLEKKYIKSVEVKKKFPNKIIIDIEGRYARWYIDFQGVYYALDSDMYVIEEIKNIDGVTKLVLPNIKTALSDEVPEFGQSETEVKETLKIIDTIRTSSLRTRVTEVNLEDRTNIRLVIDGKFDVYLGNSSSLEGKLVNVEKALNSDRVKENGEEGGAFYAETYTDKDYVSFVPYNKD